MKFADLHLSEPLLRALHKEKYEVATPIQAQSIPHILAGKDVLGSAQTGTGKTAAFALPILHRLIEKNEHVTAHKPKVLVLCPTRELAAQISDGFKAYGAFTKIRHFVIYGGVNQRPQADAMRRGVEIVIATPGRLLDLVNQRIVNLSEVHTLVLDEADRMLDMGFIHDIRRITDSLRRDRQTLLFSATMPNEIRELVNSLMNAPVKINVAPTTQTADNIEQGVYFVEKGNKPHLLAHLFHELPMARAIVFTRTKHGADKLIAKLHARGIRAEAIHGNKSQNARQRALNNFKSMKTPVLVATDIAARGIDVDGITHVVNYDLTHEPETYVHRIGRTARAGASGCAISFVDRDERSNLKAIERLIKKTIPVRTDHPEYPVGSRVEEPRDRDDRPARAARTERPHRDHKPAARHAVDTDRANPQRSRGPSDHKSFKKSARPHPKAERGFGGHAREGGRESRPHDGPARAPHAGHASHGAAKPHARPAHGKPAGASHPFAGGGRPNGRSGGRPAGAGAGKFRGGSSAGRGRR